MKQKRTFAGIGTLFAMLFLLSFGLTAKSLSESPHSMIVLKHRAEVFNKPVRTDGGDLIAKKSVKRDVSIRKAEVSAKTTIYGSLIESNNGTADVGMYSFNPVSPITLKKEADVRAFDGGGVMIDGKYYAVTFTDYGYYFMAHIRVYDPATWEEENSVLANKSCVPSDMTYDESTGKVYGCFYNDNGDGYVWGTLDMNSAYREEIKALDLPFMVVAANATGQIYAVDYNGTLLSVDKTTGNTTEIGATGVQPGATYQSGCFDPRSGALYWAAIDENGSSDLYNVDIATGQATLISSFPNGEEIVGLYAIAPAADDNAPEAITDLTVDLQGASLTGSVSFTMPTKSFGGTPLGDVTLTYTIYVNEEEQLSGSATSGEKVSQSIELPQGASVVKVVTSNAAGNSVPATADVWAGADAPKAVTDLTAEKSDNGIRLSWTAPSGSVHGGYFDPSAISYKITRLPDETEFSTTATSFTDNPTVSGMSFFSYRVTPCSGDIEGEPTESNKILLGDAFEIPYVQKLATESDLDFFTIVDANNDGSTWQVYYNCVGLPYSARDLDCDDWLISPAIHLEAGKLYNLSLIAKTYLDSTESMEVLLGTDKTPESMTTTILSPFEFCTDDFTEYGDSFSVDQSGTYYIGVHGITTYANAFRIQINNLSVTEGPSMKAPAAPDEVTVTPAPLGALNATITCKAPSKAIDGTTIETLTSIEVYIEGSDTPAAVKTTPVPGETVTFNNVDATKGLCTYSVVALNEEGRGYKAKATAFVGPDKPIAPTNVKASKSGNTITLTWEAPTTGENGGYVDPATVTYSVDQLTAGPTQVEIANGISGVQYEFLCTSEIQQTAYFAVFAETAEGVSKGRTSNTILIGPDHSLPYTESFASATQQNLSWLLDYDGASSWTTGSSLEYNGNYISAQDEDDGLLHFVPQGTNESSILKSGIIALQESVNPVLTFYYYKPVATDTELSVQVAANEGTFSTIETIDLSGSDNAGQWILCEIPLKQYLNDGRIQFAFHANSRTDDVPIGIDNIRIKDTYDYDLILSRFNGPRDMKVGHPSDFYVFVTNNGRFAAEDYTVEMYRDGKLIESQQGETIEADKSAIYTFSITPDVTFEEESTFNAVINFVRDEKNDNNKSNTATIAIEMPDYPIPTGLNATAGSNSAVLTWDEPDLSVQIYRHITETFDTYTPFSIDGIGEWTLVDVDEGTTYCNTNTYDYDNKQAAMAFQVWNPDECMMYPDDRFTPFSGNQCLASWASRAGKNDDWLISPELTGAAQTVTFLVRSTNSSYGQESYEVLYSSTDKTIESFVKIENACGEAPDSWIAVNADLPEGAKYFAIRCTSPDRFCMMVDDITYIPATAQPVVFELTGYNIYRDKQLRNRQPVVELTYTDPIDKADNYAYNVSAVYTIGESALSETAQLWLSSIDDATVAPTITIKGGNGFIEVVNANGEPIQVFSIDGKVLYNRNAVDSTTIPVIAGQYVVRAGNTSAVVIVK